VRDALKYAQAFAVWLDVQEELGDLSPFPGLMESWLAEESEKITRLFLFSRVLGHFSMHSPMKAGRARRVTTKSLGSTLPSR
jgi:hypothetical protein